jgi:predicted lipoprotein
MKRTIIILCFLLAACGVFWKFPLFHVARLDAMQAAAQRTSFDAPTFVAAFWEDRLVPALDAAPDASTVISALEKDRSSALKTFGRKVGVGRTTLLIVQGNGAIVSVDAKAIGVSLTPDHKEPDILLQTGLLFGNAVRDATGLLDASDFENSQQFNEISTELNRRFETTVIPALKQKAALGRHIEFVGCAEVSDNAKTVRPLMLIPLVVNFNEIVQQAESVP